MAKYIDADALKHDLAVLFKSNPLLIDEWLANCVDDVIDEHKERGGVEVVRCKECKYFYKASKYCSEFMTKDEDGFCSWGERRDDAET